MKKQSLSIMLVLCWLAIFAVFLIVDSLTGNATKHPSMYVWITLYYAATPFVVLIALMLLARNSYERFPLFLATGFIILAAVLFIMNSIMGFFFFIFAAPVLALFGAWRGCHMLRQNNKILGAIYIGFPVLLICLSVYSYYSVRL